METLQIDGITYQKVSSAARDTGYTADYVGQLCRAGKINAKLVGRTWYIEKDAIGGHKREKVRSNSSQTRKGLVAELKVHSETNRAIPVSMHPLYSPSRYRDRILAEGVRYEKDETQLIPTTASTLSTEEKSHENTDHQLSHQIPVLKSIDVLSEEEMPEPEPEVKKTEVKWSGTIVVAPVEEVEDTGIAMEETPIIAPDNTYSGFSEGIFQPLKQETTHKHSEDFLTAEEKEDMLGVSHKQQPNAVPVYALKLPVVLATAITCAFLASATFIQGVWVYQNGTQTAEPYMTTTYNITSVQNLASLIAK
jgi:hypothetical protein